MPKEIDILSLTYGEMREIFASLGERDFRGDQVFKWIYRKGVLDFALMTDLEKRLRGRLPAVFRLEVPEPEEVLEGGDGTRKFLLRLEDGEPVEAVLIPEEERTTLCISSQVGCPLGCTFCITGQMGFRRDLTASEMIEEVLMARHFLRRGRGISNIVFMGMGEPLLNYENVVKAVRIMMEEKGLRFSPRRVTISTAGIIPAMERLGRELSVNLSVSLNAATQDLREALMPVSKKYPLDALIETLRRYPLPRRKRISIEYVMMKGVNDSPADARRLVKILHGVRCKVNLLRLNRGPGIPYEPPGDEGMRDFQSLLMEKGIFTSIRKSRGGEIFAACGQLGQSLSRGK